MRVLVVIAIASLLAGCASTAPGGAIVPPPVGEAARAFDGLGQPVPLPADPGLSTFRVLDLQHRGGEPTMGIDSKGAIYVVSDTKILKSVDQGKTWSDASPVTNWPVGSLDPYVYVDDDTGRVYADHLYVACSYLMWSDDGGKSWLNNPAACGIPGDDHQTVAAGKPNDGTPTIGYKNVVYYAYNGNVYSGVARSLDGGITFAAGAIAIDNAHCGGLNGHLRTDIVGTVYLPAAGCDQPVVAVSRDAGITWEQHVIDTGGVGRSTPGDDPSLALDRAGNAFLVFPGKDAKMYASMSPDKGKTWGPAFKISPPTITSSLMPASVAGDAGRVAFAYYATSANTSGWATPNSDDADSTARWNLYVTTSADAQLGPKATWVTTQVNDDAHPVKIGKIHNGGGGDPDRNLLDFFDMAIDPDGRVFVTFTSGCPKSCSTQEDSRDRATMVARLDSGQSLLHDKGRLAPP